MAEHPPPLPRWVHRFFWAMIAVAVIGLFVGAGLLATPPNVTATLNPTPDGSMQLDVRRNFKVNTIRLVEIYPEGQEHPVLWQFDPKPTPPTEVSVRLHDGEPHDRGRLNRRILSGEHFCIRVSYQYDSLFPPAPCIADKVFHFKLRTDGTAELIGAGL